MGSLVSKFVFLPPKNVSIPDEEDIILSTSHGSRIQVKILDRYAPFTIIISHGNAEDIYSILYWAENVLLKYVNINVVMYGNYYFMKEYTGYGSNEEGLVCNEKYIYNDISIFFLVNFLEYVLLYS